MFQTFNFSLDGTIIENKAVSVDARSKQLSEQLNLNVTGWDNYEKQTVKEQSNLSIFFLGFLGGLIALLTPCVFPMYPILSGIVIGQGKTISTSRAFTLSFVYVQGMAITYSILGLIVASAGVQFQAALQHPAILIGFVIFFLLYLLLFLSGD